MTNTPIIAIDGPAASGKGTISRKLAEKLQFAHMDTGALYRAVGATLLTAQLNGDVRADCIEAAHSFTENFDPAFLNSTDLRTNEAGVAASKCAAVPEVRRALFDLQRSFAAHPPSPALGSVLDGRDIGTVICPDATAKLFITASLEIRSARRTKELQSKGQSVTYERVLQDMRERDTRDAGREDAPMVIADDAFVLDTSDLTIDEAFDKALAFIQSKLSA